MKNTTDEGLPRPVGMYSGHIPLLVGVNMLLVC